MNIANLDRIRLAACKPGLSFTRTLLCLALAAHCAESIRAADLYVDTSANSDGDGTAARPYWRITDAVERARLLRQGASILPSELIVIHVAAGAYLGSKEPSILAKNPRYEVLPVLLNMPNLTLAGSTIITT